MKISSVTSEKMLVNPPFRNILSALQTYAYKIAKILLLFLESLTTDKYTVKDLLSLAPEVIDQDSSKFIDSIDTHFMFNNTLYRQIGGVMMASG